jgi:uncharacterized protein YbcI
MLVSSDSAVLSDRGLVSYDLAGFPPAIRSRPFVSQHTVQQRPHAHGDVLTAISDGMVALLKEFYGHGPSRTKSYYADDLVVCVLRGGFSRVEQTPLEGGRGAAVIEQRMEFQELMRERFEEVIEQATGRPVIGFMSGNQQHPDRCARSSSSRPPISSTSTRSRRTGGPRRLADATRRQAKRLRQTPEAPVVSAWRVE